MAIWSYLWAWSWITKWLYHLEGNANDDSGNSANGTATNVTWQWWNIWSGSWLFVRSSWSKVVTPFSDPWSASTFVIKIKTTTTASWFDEYSAITKRNWSFTFQMAMVSPSNTTKISMYDWGVTATRIYSWVINDWKRHTVAMTMTNNTTASIYTDWFKTWTSSSFSFVTQSFSNWNLIWDFNTWWRAFDWSMDEFIVENVAWNDAQHRKYHTYSKWWF